MRVFIFHRKDSTVGLIQEEKDNRGLGCESPDLLKLEMDKLLPDSYVQNFFAVQMAFLLGKP